MERQFDKQKTNVAKGVAVLILLVHHIFYNYARGLEFPNMKFLFPRLTYHLADYGAFVIFVFATISGYGIAAYMSKKEDNITKCIIQREIGLLETFVPMYILAVGLCAVLNGNLAFLFQTYGATKRDVVIGAAFDMFGISSLFSRPKLNNTWWYMGAAHCIIIFIPILIKLAKLIKSKTAILLALIVYVGFGQNTAGSQYRACVLAAFIGVCMYEGKIIERVDKFFAQKKFGRIFEFVIYVVAVWFVLWFKASGALGGYYLWALTVPFTLFIVNDFISKIKGVNFLLAKLGTYSGLIYMLHTFVYKIIPRLNGITYSMEYAWQAYIFVLAVTLGLSVLLTTVLKLVRYDRLILKIKERLLG